MTRIALLVLAALAVSASNRDAVRRGPPLICHEIEIGSAASLPWKSVGYGMGPEPSFAIEKVIPEALKVLRTSDDALVHMETLRRAYIYLQSSPPEENLADLGARLKEAVLLTSTPDSPRKTPSARRETLAWFDFAYLVAIVNNNGGGKCDFMRDASCHGLLERAAANAPKDAGLQFGVGIGQAFNWIPRGIPDGYQDLWRAHGWKHLQTALELTTDADSLVGRNLRSFFGTGYGPTTRPATLDEVRKKVAAQIGLQPPGTHGTSLNPNTDTRPGTRPSEGDVISCPLGENRPPLLITMIGTVNEACGKVVVVQALHSGAPSETRIAEGTILDVISSDKKTYVGRVCVIGRTGETIACTVLVSGPRAFKSGDLLVAGLN